MKSVLVNCEIHQIIDFNTLDKREQFKMFYEELYNNCGFLQDFIKKPFLKIGKWKKILETTI